MEAIFQSQQQHGSGKTTVLVERMINKIIKEKIDINQLLIVTFTNAAASEMREKILEAIYKKIEEEPENKNLNSNLKPEYTFENFVIGDSNRFAQLAALAVAEQPGKIYNPL